MTIVLFIFLFESFSELFVYLVFIFGCVLCARINGLYIAVYELLVELKND